MDKKFLNRIFLFVAAGVLLSLGVVGALRAARPVPQTGPVVLEEAQAEMVSVDAVEVTPEPTPEPLSYQNTVTLLVDRVPVMTLGTELAAKQMLWEYLNSSTAPEGEKFLSARFDCELILTPADPYSKPLEASEALEMLATNPSLVPVRVTTLRTQISEESPQISSSEESALPKGERVEAALDASRLYWLHVATGEVSIGGQPLSAGDALAFIDEGQTLSIEGVAEASELLWFDLPR